ncbi:MAG: sulfatase [Planctomycetes bacterium]|nr:sulfatase [Planctomycetota bacterium]
MRKQYLIMILIFVTLPVSGFAESQARTNRDKPNVLLIISDDQAWTDYSMFGHEQVKTPHIDKLAQSGVLFRRGYVPTALCRPSLMSLATGQYAHVNGITGNDPQGNKRKDKAELISFIQNFETLPTLLKEQGYVSHQSGKWWEGNFKNGGFTHGMTQGFPNPGGRHGDKGLSIGRTGLKPCTDFIDMAVKDNKPFFMWYAPFLPHTPHNPPERLLKKYEKYDIPLPHKKYYAMIEWFDETCGELVGYLESKGIRDNTLIVYVGDNGWISRDDKTGFARRSKLSAYEGGVRQPTIYSWPAKIKPADHPGLVTSIDIVPTILAAAGARQPKKSLPGMNLLPVIAGQQEIKDRAVFGENFSHNIADIHKPEGSLLRRWVIQGNYKLIISYDGVDKGYGRDKPDAKSGPMLFDLSKDPHEKKNLYNTLPDVYKSLRTKIDNWYPLKERKAYK